MASSRSQYRGSFNRCLIVVVSFLQDILFRCNIESAVSMIELRSCNVKRAEHSYFFISDSPSWESSSTFLYWYLKRLRQLMHIIISTVQTLTEVPYLISTRMCIGMQSLICAIAHSPCSCKVDGCVLPPIDNESKHPTATVGVMFPTREDAYKTDVHYLSP